MSDIASNFSPEHHPLSDNPYIQINVPSDNPNNQELEKYKTTFSVLTRSLPLIKNVAIEGSQKDPSLFLNQEAGRLNESELASAHIIEEMLNMNECLPALYEAYRNPASSEKNTNLRIRSIVRQHLSRYLTIEDPSSGLYSISSEIPGKEQKIIIQTPDQLATYLHTRLDKISDGVSLSPDNLTMQANPNLLNFNRPEDCDTFANTTRRINHDLRNSVVGFHYTRTSLSGRPFTSEQFAAKTSYLHDTFMSIIQSTDSSVEVALNRYPKENVSLPDLLAELDFWQAQAAEQNLDIVFDHSSFQDFGNMRWSYDWLASILRDISQNATKGYNARDQRLREETPEALPQSRPIYVSNRVIQIGERWFNDIVIRDLNGLGHPGNIVVGGYQPQTSYWASENVSGTGVGMDGHRYAIERKYDGYLLPRVQRDPHTGEILGTETVIRIPLSSYDQSRLNNQNSSS